jgi:hypothetical protein
MHRSNCVLFDHLVGAGQRRRRDIEADGLGAVLRLMTSIGDWTVFLCKKEQFNYRV